MFITAECIISQRAELQDTAALLTIETEYMAVVDVSKEALQLRGLVEMFDIIQDPIQVHYDSQNVINLAKDHRYLKQMEYIDVRYHKIRQWVMDDKMIDLVKINTKKNLADIVTP